MIFTGDAGTDYEIQRSSDLRTWATQAGIPWIEFHKGERKDEVVQPYRERCTAHGGRDGVVLVICQNKRHKQRQG